MPGEEEMSDGEEAGDGARLMVWPAVPMPPLTARQRDRPPEWADSGKDSRCQTLSSIFFRFLFHFLFGFFLLLLFTGG